MSIFGSKQISCVGFGLGDVTIKNYLEVHGLVPELRTSAEIMVLFPDFSDASVGRGFACAAELRKAGFIVETAFPDEALRLDKQFKSANRRGIKVVVMSGEAEITKNEVAVKNMESGEQWSVPDSELRSKVGAILAR